MKTSPSECVPCEIMTVFRQTIKAKAMSLGYQKIYLSTFDVKIADYYTRLGWTKIDMAEFNGHPMTVMEVSLFE